MTQLKLFETKVVFGTKEDIKNIFFENKLIFSLFFMFD